MGFQLLSGSIITVIEGVDVSLNIISDCSRCIKVFKLLVYLNTRAYTVVLFKTLHARNFLLLRLPFCLIAAAIYRVSVEFLFWLSRNLREEGWI